MKKLSKEIYEINGLNSFVKIKNDSFGIEKVLLAFVTYDKESHALISSGNYYLSFADALHLCWEIEKCVIHKDVNAEKQRAQAANEKYAKAVRSFQGGTEKAERKDRNPLARVFTIEPGMSSPERPIVFKYEDGPGIKKGNLIVPLWWERGSNKQSETRIFVPMSAGDLVKMAVLLRTHIEQYIGHCYATDAYLTEFEQKGNNSGPSETKGQNQTVSNKTVPIQEHAKNPAPAAQTKPQEQKKENKENQKAKGKVQEFRFISSIQEVNGNPNLMYAHVQPPGTDKTVTLWIERAVLEKSGRKKEFLQAMKENSTVHITWQLKKDGENSYAYFVG